MELAAFGAVEASIGRFPSPPLRPHAVVRFNDHRVTNNRHLTISTGLSTRRPNLHSCKRGDCDNRRQGQESFDTNECTKPVEREAPTKHSSSLPYPPLSGQCSHDRLKQPRVRWSATYKNECHRDTDVAVGVDIPQAAAHLTCLMSHRTLEVYDSSPHARFLPDPAQAPKSFRITEKSAGTVLAEAEAVTATAKTSTHIDAALKRASEADGPQMPCLLRIELPASLLSAKVFDVVVASSSAPYGGSSGSSEYRARRRRLGSCGVAYGGYTTSTATHCSGSNLCSSSCTEEHSSTSRDCIKTLHGANGRKKRRNSPTRHPGSSSYFGFFSSDHEPEGNTCTACRPTQPPHAAQKKDVSSIIGEGKSHLEFPASCCRARPAAYAICCKHRYAHHVKSAFSNDKLMTSTSSQGLTAAASSATGGVPSCVSAARVKEADANVVVGAGTPEGARGDRREEIRVKSYSLAASSTKSHVESFNAAPSTAARVASSLVSRRGYRPYWPVLIICFVLENGELHLLQLKMREAQQSWQEEVCSGTADIDALDEKRCFCEQSLAVSEVADVCTVMGERKRRQLQLSVQNHLFVVLMCDGLPSKENTLAVKSYGDVKSCSPRTTAVDSKATLHSLFNFFTCTEPSLTDSGGLEKPSKQHVDLGKPQSCEPFNKDPQQERHQCSGSDEVLLGHISVDGSNERSSCASEDDRRQLATPQARNDVVRAEGGFIHDRSTTGARLTASSEEDKLSSALSVERPPLRFLLLLNSQDVLLGYWEPSLYRVLRFGEMCRSSGKSHRQRHRVGRRRRTCITEDHSASDPAISSCTVVAANTAYGSTQGCLTIEGDQNTFVGAQGLDAATEATTGGRHVLFGRWSRPSLCSKRKRSVEGISTEGTRMWRTLCSSWSLWKRHREAKRFLCRLPFANNVPAYHSSRSNSKGCSTIALSARSTVQTLPGHGGATGDPEEFCCHVEQEDVRGLPAALRKTSTYGGDNTMMSAFPRLQLFKSGHAEKRGSFARTLLRRLIMPPPRVVPYLIERVARLRMKKGKGQQEMQERKASLPHPQESYAIERAGLHRRQPQNRDVNIGKASAIAAAAHFIERHRRRLSLEEVSRIRRFQSLWAASQPIVRLPQSIVAGADVCIGDCLLVTCSRVSGEPSLPSKHQQPLSDVTRLKDYRFEMHSAYHLPRGNKELEREDEQEKTGDQGRGCLKQGGQQIYMFSGVPDNDEPYREIMHEEGGTLVIVGIWRYTSACSHRLSTKNAVSKLTPCSSGVCEAPPISKCDDTSPVQKSGEQILFLPKRRKAASSCCCRPSLQLLCKYTYIPDDTAAEPHELHMEFGKSESTIPHGSSLWRQNGEKNRSMLTSQGGTTDVPQLAALVRPAYIYGGKAENEIDVLATRPHSINPVAAAPTRSDLSVESIYVATAAGAETAVPEGTAMAGWWIGVSLTLPRKIAFADTHSATIATTRGKGASCSSPNESASSSCSSNPYSGRCHMNSGRHFLLLRCCVKKDLRGINCRLEKAGELRWSYSGVLLGSDAAVKEVFSSQSLVEWHKPCSEDAVIKSSSEDGGRTGEQLTADKPFFSTSSLDGEGMSIRTSFLRRIMELSGLGEKSIGREEDERGSLQHSILQKQRQPVISHTTMLLTATHLWLCVVEAPTLESVYGKRMKGSEDDKWLLYTHELLPPADTRHRPLCCCCPRRTVWAIPLPPFNASSYDKTWTASSFSPFSTSFSSASVVSSCSSADKRFVDTHRNMNDKTDVNDVAAEVQRKMVWPAGVKPFRVLPIDAPPCLKKCSNPRTRCSAILQERIHNIAEISCIITRLSRVRAAVRSVLRRCLAAMASSAAAEDPSGGGTAAAAGAAAAASLWNYQPLVTDAFPTVFSASQNIPEGAAAALLDWVACNLTDSLRSPAVTVTTDTSGSSGDSVYTTKPMVSLPLAPAARGKIRGVEVEHPLHVSSKNTYPCDKAVAATCPLEAQGLLGECLLFEEDIGPRGCDLLVALLNEYPVFLRRKGAHVEEFRARMQEFFSAARRGARAPDGEETSVSHDGMKKRRLHSRAAVDCSHLRLLLELVTDALCRDVVSSQTEGLFQGGEGLVHQEDLKGSLPCTQPARKRQKRVHPEHGKKVHQQEQQQQWEEGTAVIRKLIAASIVSLMVCWHLRRLVQRCASAASNDDITSLLSSSCVFLGESYVWGDVLQQARSTASSGAAVAAVEGGRFSAYEKNPQALLRIDAADITTRSPLGKSLSWSPHSYDVEDALLQSPFGCILADGIFKHNLTVRTSGQPEKASLAFQASMCRCMSSSSSSLCSPTASGAGCVFATAVSRGSPLAIPLLLRRHNLGVTEEAAALRAPADSTFIASHVGRRRCYSLSLIRPALTPAEEIGWQLHQSLSEAVFCAAEGIIAADGAPADDETQERPKEEEEGRKNFFTRGSCCIEDDKYPFDQTVEEKAEAGADCLALKAVLNLLTAARTRRVNIWQTPLSQACARLNKAKKRTEHKDMAVAAVSEAASARDTVHDAGAASSEVHSQDAFRHIITSETGQRMSFGATQGDVDSAALEPTAGAAVPFFTQSMPLDIADEASMSSMPFFTEFLRGDALDADAAGQHSCMCRCNTWSTCLDTDESHHTTSCQRRDTRLKSSSDVSRVTVGSVLQRERRERLLLGRLQHTQRLSSSISWQLAAVGSFLRLGAAAVLHMQRQWARQQRSQTRLSVRPEVGRCAQPRTTGGEEGEWQESGCLEAPININAQRPSAGRGLMKHTNGLSDPGEMGAYATHNSDSVWSHLQTVLCKRSVLAEMRYPKEVDAYREQIIGCAAAALAPFVDKCTHTGLSPCYSHATSAVGHRPAAFSSSSKKIVAPGGPTESLGKRSTLTSTDGLSKLLRSLSCHSLLPVCLDERVVWQLRAPDVPGAPSQVYTTSSVAAVKARWSPNAKVPAYCEKQSSPLQLRVAPGRGVVLVLQQVQPPHSSLDIETLLDAHAAAVVPGYLTEAAEAPALPAEDRELAAVAGHAAAAAVTACVGVQCAPFLRSLRPPQSSHVSYASLAAEWKDWRQRQKLPSVPQGAGLRFAAATAPFAEKTDRNKAGELQNLLNSDHGNQSQNTLPSQRVQWMLEAEAATAVQHDIVECISFIAAPVHRILAEAVSAGIKAQHRILCNLAAGAGYFQRLLLQRQQQRVQEHALPRGRQQQQQHEEGRITQEKLHQEPQQQKKEKQQTQARVAVNGKRREPFSCCIRTNSEEEGYSTPRDAPNRIQAQVAAGSLRASDHPCSIAPGSFTLPVTCSPPTDRDRTACGDEGDFSPHAEDAPGNSCTGSAPRSSPASFPSADNNKLSIHSEAQSAPCLEQKLVSWVLKALDASLPLAAGICCLFEKPKTSFCSREYGQSKQQRGPQSPSDLQLQQYGQPTDKCLHRASKRAKDFASSSHRAVIAAAGERCGSENRPLSAGKGKTSVCATSCGCHSHYSVTAADEPEEETRMQGYRDHQLLLFLMLCEFSRGRMPFASESGRPHQRQKRRRRRKSSRLLSKYKGRLTRNGIRLGPQTTKIEDQTMLTICTKSDTETSYFVRRVGNVRRFVPSEDAADHDSEAYDSAPAPDNTAKSAFQTPCTTNWMAVGVPEPLAAQAAISSIEEPHGLALLIPWLVRSLCDGRLPMRVLIDQRLRAAAKLADYLAYSPSTLHRLVAHSLRCWTYHERSMSPTSSSAAASDVYSEILKTAWTTARLFTCLRQRTQELSRVTATASQNFNIQQHWRRLVASADSERPRHQREVALSEQCNGGTFCESKEEKGEDRQPHKQLRQHEGEVFRGPQWLAHAQDAQQHSEEWQQQQQEEAQELQEKDGVAPCRVGGLASQSFTRKHQRVCTASRRRVDPHTTKTFLSACGSSDEYCWACYAQQLHQIACRLQQYYPETPMTLMLEPPSLLHQGVLTHVPSAFQSEAADDLPLRMARVSEDTSAAAAGGVKQSRDSGASSRLALASSTTEEGADQTKSGAATAGRMLSIRVAVMHAAAEAATISSKLREKRSTAALTDPPVVVCTGSQRRLRCVETRDIEGMSEYDHVVRGEATDIYTDRKEMKKKNTSSLQPHSAAIVKAASGKIRRRVADLVALLRMCCRILPHALPGVTELWKAALTASLQEGNISAATTMLPMLPCLKDREESLLRILAGLLMSQWPRTEAWETGTTALCQETARLLPNTKHTFVCGDRTRALSTYAKRSCNSVHKSSRRHTLHRLREDAEGVSLATLREASGISQKRLSLEGILLRLSVSADCGDDGPALAAFHLLKKEFLSSGRHSDTALLAFLHAAAVQTELYATSSAYLGGSAAAAAAPSSRTVKIETASATKVAVGDATAARHFVEMVATDEYFPSWLLVGLKQLQDVGQHQHSLANALSKTAPSASYAEDLQSPCTPMGCRPIQEPNSFASYKERQGPARTIQESQRCRRQHDSRREDYKEHLRLLAAAEIVRAHYLTLLSGFTGTGQAHQPPLARLLATAGGLHPDSGVVADSAQGADPAQAPRATARIAAGESDLAHFLCLKFQRSLCSLEYSASLCSSLLYDIHQPKTSPFLSFPFSSILLQKFECSHDAIAPASEGILLLPSIVRPLFFQATNSDTLWHVGSGCRALPQKSRLLHPGSHRGQQQRQNPLATEPRSGCPLSWEDALSQKGQAVPPTQPSTTLPKEYEVEHCFGARKAYYPSSTGQVLPLPVPAAMAMSAGAPGATLSQSRWPSAAAVAADVVQLEVLKRTKQCEPSPCVTALLARRIAALAGAKLRLLQDAPSEIGAVQQLLPWRFQRAETVATLGFAGQLCAGIQLADVSQVDVFIPCASFIAYVVTLEATVASEDESALGCWRLLVQQLRLRQASAASGTGPAADGGFVSTRGRKIQLEADVRALHSRLLQLLTVVQDKLEKDGLPPPPAFVFEHLREGELPADAVAALGRLLHQGRLQEAYALVLREQRASEERRQQLDALRRGTGKEELLICEAFRRKKEKGHTGHNRGPLGTSEFGFLDLAWPLLMQLQAALIVAVAEQWKLAGAQLTSAAATEATAAPEKMLATLQGILDRYEKASTVANLRSAQLVRLALKPAETGLFPRANRDVSGGAPRSVQESPRLRISSDTGI